METVPLIVAHSVSVAFGCRPDDSDAYGSLDVQLWILHSVRKGVSWPLVFAAAQSVQTISFKPWSGPYGTNNPLRIQWVWLVSAAVSSITALILSATHEKVRDFDFLIRCLPFEKRLRGSCARPRLSIYILLLNITYLVRYIYFYFFLGFLLLNRIFFSTADTGFLRSTNFK